MTAQPGIRMWQQPDGLWRWSFAQPGEAGEPGTTLYSHLAYDTAQEARDSARTAYPELEPPPLPAAAPAPPARTRRRRRLWLAVVALLLLYLLRRRGRAGHRGDHGARAGPTDPGVQGWS